MTACNRALAAFLVLAPLAVTAQERILSFDSEIELALDRSMSVTETIRVRAEGERIQRGIYRDFPTEYRDRLGNRYRVLFEVVGVSRDGSSEPYFTERRNNGFRLYAGSADTLLDPGEYEYRIRYRTNRQLGFFANHDELYWNVTGNGWDFAIESASASISLPPETNAGIETIEGYVGAEGSREQSYEEAIGADGVATIATTRALGPREGLTLVATWAKGVIPEPTAAEQTQNLLTDNLGLLVALAGLAAAAAWLVFAWHRAGRDPDPGVIFPHYEPPQDISPASMRYVSRMGYDMSAFTAATINLAVKGYLRIEETDGDYTLHKTGPGNAPLAPGEKALLRALFRNGDTLALDNENHETVRAAMAAHKASLNRDFSRIYFRTNSTLLIPAFLILAAAFLVVVLMAQLTALTVIVLAPIAVLIVVFYFLLKAPTTLGRRLLDKIEGFKLYLEVAEKDDIASRNPPERTPELFEAYLPYALALGVERAWADKFVSVFERLATETGEAYRPVWYHGAWSNRSLTANLGALTGMTSGLGSAIAAAATPPGSSSGAGGAGFSGGGGGGGGGGGW